MKSFGVYSEVGKLRKVLVCRPGLAHERLTPSNCREFLFDDVLWVDQAIKDHQKLVDLMRSYSVEVLDLHDLLEEVFLDKAHRKLFLNKKLRPSLLMDAYEDFFSYLMEMDSKSFTKYMIGGLLKEEIPIDLGKTYNKLVSGNEFVIRPLPNTLFTRDQSAWIGESVQISSMRYDARQEETLLLETVYQYHPCFSVSERLFSAEYEKHCSGYSIEGGDILVASKDLVLIGIGERTKHSAAYHLAKQLFKRGEIKKIIAIEIAHGRASMHLDTVFTFCDRDAVSFYPEVFREFKMKSLFPSQSKEGEIDVVEEKEDLTALLEKGLGIKKIRVVETGGDRFTRQREQWDDANNVVCLEPGLVLAYDRNKNTLSNFVKQGIKVELFPSSELGRGRGGGRCMTCPILRDA